MFVRRDPYKSPLYFIQLDVDHVEVLHRRHGRDGRFRTQRCATGASTGLPAALPGFQTPLIPAIVPQELGQ